jgi:hypothetical protein
MAEQFDKFWISIDADVSTLQTELIKAQNQLRQFQTTLKKSTDVESIKLLNANITFLEDKIAHLNNRMQGVAKPTGDATQSLINLSRIAQDAPYGFMGIANNINPMLESFQRLQKETGSAKTALQSMLSALTGPQGIGLAIGVASSLLVVFSKQIANYFSGATSELEDFRKELAKLNEDLFKIAGSAQAKQTKGEILVAIIGDSAKDMQTRKNALEMLKSLYAENKAIQDLKVTNDKNFLIDVLNNASQQSFGIDKEKNNNEALSQAYEKRKQLVAKQKAQIDALKTIRREGEGGVVYTISIETQANAIKKANKKAFDEVDADIKRYKGKEVELVGFLSGFTKVDKTGVKKTTQDNSIQEYINQQISDFKNLVVQREKFRDKLKKITLEIIPYLNSVELAKQQKAEENKTFADLVSKNIDTTKFEEMLSKMGKKQLGDLTEEEQKRKDATDALKEETKAYEDFAKTLSNDVTNAILGMWNAMQKGENPLDAIGNMFAKIAESIAAAIIQASIFEAILTAFPELKPILAAVGWVQGGFKFGAHAKGGITTGPSLGLIGEAGPEAIMPLDKLKGFLNTSFNAGAMSGATTGNSGQFVLRGQDLLVAINRTQKSSFLKGQNISLV